MRKKALWPKLSKLDTLTLILLECLSRQDVLIVQLINGDISYGTEPAVGAAVKKSGIPRSQIFITTKLWNNGSSIFLPSINEA